VTDTGELREMLDLAEQAWPDVGDRRQLLLRLAAAGRDRIAEQAIARDEQGRRERQRAALERAPDRVDAELLLGDAAWH